MSDKPVRFWSWYFRGTKHSRSGFADTFLTIATSICLILSIVLTCFANVTETHDLAKTMVRSMIGIFIGVSFTGAAFALSLISSEEIQEIISKSKKTKEDYIFGIQSASLLLLLSIVILTIIAAKIYPEPFMYSEIFYRFLVFFVFFRGLWECWIVINLSIGLMHLKIIFTNNKKQTESNKQEP